MAHENQLVAAEVGNKSCEKETLSTYHVVGNLLVAPKRAPDVKMGLGMYCSYTPSAVGTWICLKYRKLPSFTNLKSIKSLFFGKPHIHLQFMKFMFSNQKKIEKEENRPILFWRIFFVYLFGGSCY